MEKIRDLLAALLEVYTIQRVREFGGKADYTSHLLRVDFDLLDEEVYSAKHHKVKVERVNLPDKVVRVVMNTAKQFSRSLISRLRDGVGWTIPDLSIKYGRHKILLEVKTTMYLPPVVPLHESLVFRAFSTITGRPLYFGVYHISRDGEVPRVSFSLYGLKKEVNLSLVPIPKHQLRLWEKGVREGRGTRIGNYIIFKTLLGVKDKNTGRVRKVYSIKDQLEEVDMESLPVELRYLFSGIKKRVGEYEDTWRILDRDFGLFSLYRSGRKG